VSQEPQILVAVAVLAVLTLLVKLAVMVVQE
jgi:hypothetical protein